MSVSVYDENVYVNGCIKTYAMRQVACRYGIERGVACRVVLRRRRALPPPLVPVNPPHYVHFLPETCLRAVTCYLPSRSVFAPTTIYLHHSPIGCRVTTDIY